MFQVHHYVCAAEFSLISSIVAAHGQSATADSTMPPEGATFLGKQRHLPRPRLAALHHIDRAAPRRTLAVVDLAQIDNMVLNHPAAADSDVLDHASIAVPLAVLEASFAAYEHGQSVRHFASPIKEVGRYYTRFWRPKVGKFATFRAEKPSPSYQAKRPSGTRIDGLQERTSAEPPTLHCEMRCPCAASCRPGSSSAAAMSDNRIFPCLLAIAVRMRCCMYHADF